MSERLGLSITWRRRNESFGVSSGDLSGPFRDGCCGLNDPAVRINVMPMRGSGPQCQR